MIKFNNRMFGQCVDAIVKKQGFFHGRRISTKTQLYTLIGEELHQSPETVRGWRKATSSGPNPKDPEVLRELETYLNLEEGALLTEDGLKKIEVKENNKMGNIATDFQKMQIMECYEALKKFVSDMAIEDEDKYYCLRNFIETKKIALPDEVNQAFLNILDVVETYVFCDHTPEVTLDEAEYNEEGILLLKSEDASIKVISFFMKNLLELDEKIESFGKELKQYLWA